MLSDPKFKKYRTKFKPPHDENIEESMYLQCTYNYSNYDNDDDSLVYFPAAVNYPEKESTSAPASLDQPELPATIEPKNSEEKTAGQE